MTLAQGTCPGSTRKTRLWPVLVSLPLTACLSTLRGARLGSKVSWSGNMLMGDCRRPWGALVIQTHLRVEQGIVSQKGIRRCLVAHCPGRVDESPVGGAGYPVVGPPGVPVSGDGGRQQGHHHRRALHPGKLATTRETLANIRNHSQWLFSILGNFLAYK